MIDTHAHLTAEAFAADRVDVLARAREAGLEKIVAIGSGYGVERNLDAIRLAEQVDFIKATAGLHPHDAKLWDNTAADLIAEWLKHDEVVAVGECGLDYAFGRDASKAKQFEAFAAQCQLAVTTGKPLIVHTRDAFADTLAMLKEYEIGNKVAGVIHFFTASRAEADAYLAQGLMLSVPGVVTFPKLVELHETVMSIPVERLLLETDCPYAAPVPMRGKRNEPAFVRHTAEKIAALKGIDVGQFIAQTTANAKHFFGF